MTVLPEKKIEQLLRDAVRAEGGRAYKFVSPGNDGVPDRIVCMQGGRTVFAELKRHGGKLTHLQEIQIARLKETGQDVAVVEGLNGLIGFLEKYGMPKQADKIRRAHKNDL